MTDDVRHAPECEGIYRTAIGGANSSDPLVAKLSKEVLRLTALLSETGPQREALLTLADNALLHLTAHHQSGPDWAKGVEIAREYMARRNESEAMKAPACASPKGSDAHDAKCWREINSITHNDLALAIEQAKRFAVRTDERSDK